MELPTEHITHTDGDDPPNPPLSAVTVDIAIPVHDEEQALPGCVAVLHEFLTDRMPFGWTITIVVNASVDGTYPAALRTAR